MMNPQAENSDNERHIEVLKGDLALPASDGSLYPYTLIQTSKDAHAPCFFNFSPPLPDDVLIADIKVGKNSQGAGPGYFNASILRQSPEIGMDYAEYGMSITITFVCGKNAYQGRAMVECHHPRIGNEALRQSPPYGRSLFAPFNAEIMAATCAPATLKRIVVSPKACARIENGTLVPRFHFAAYKGNADQQNTPGDSSLVYKEPLPLEFKDDSFYPTNPSSPMRFGVYDALAIKFMGANVSPYEFLPIMEPLP